MSKNNQEKKSYFNEVKKMLTGTHRAIGHHLETGAEVGQTDMAVHIEQHIIRLYVPKNDQMKKTLALSVF